MEPFREEPEPERERQEELERENAELKEKLDRAQRPVANGWIVPALVATIVLGLVLWYVLSRPPRPPIQVPAALSSSATHVDFAQPGPAPAKDAWVAVPLPVHVPLYALAAGVDVTYAAGAKGTVLRKQTGEDVWSQEKMPTEANLHGVAIQMDHVLAVGEQGTIVELPSSATAFRAVPSGTKETLRAVAFSYLGPVAVGDHGTLLVDMTGAWSAEKSGTTETLRAICAGLQAIVAVGDHGTILRRDGDRWVQEASGTTADLRGVSCDDRRLVAVGAGGVVVQRDEPGASFKVRTQGQADLFSVDAYYGTSSWIAVGRGAALQRATGVAQAQGLVGDLYAVKQGTVGTCVVGEAGLFLDARAP